MIAGNLVWISAALVLGLATPTAGAPVDNDLRIAGIGLSTSLTAFLDRNPEAQIERFEAIRYCYGEAVAIEPFGRVVASATAANRRIEVEFRRRGGSLRAVRIRGHRILPAETLDFASIRDELLARHGPYDRRVVRRKMEPAGLIFGFEWQRGDMALLSVRIHRDHGEDFDRVLESSLLTDQLPGMRSATEAAAQARQAIDEFHRVCAHRAAATE